MKAFVQELVLLTQPHVSSSFAFSFALMSNSSTRRHRHRKRPRHMTPISPGMFFVPYGQALPFDGSSASSASPSSSSSESESEDDERVAKKMLTEMRSLRKATEALLTRQHDLAQKLEKHLKATAPQAKPKTPVKKPTPKKAAPIKKAAPTKPKPTRAQASKLTISMRHRGPPPVVFSRQRPTNRDVTKKHKKVIKKHVLQLIASQLGCGENSDKAAQAYDKLLGLARKEVAIMQRAIGTPGRSTGTFGSELVRPHRLSSRKNLEQMALSDVTPRIDLAVCADSWAADYILRRVWEGARNRIINGQSEDAEDDESDSTPRASRVPEVRSES
ncbi:hypothetical protein BJV82DRAFT_87715 [Fennellomyces sp. T-0311]|nr:hypothetical protein BJV82DRAFT_87715 [Fennellomyces sp. T-0311]